MNVPFSWPLFLAYTAAEVPMLQRDSRQSFASQVYTSALKVANPQQKAYLQAEVQRRKIRTGPMP